MEDKTGPPENQLTPNEAQVQNQAQIQRPSPAIELVFCQNRGYPPLNLNLVLNLNFIACWIVILSDMQGWMEVGTPDGVFEKYKKRTAANPFVYSFDLAGHGSTQLPAGKVHCLAGFSDKVFDLMQMLETDRNALITQINAVRFN